MSVISGDQYEIRKVLLDCPVIKATVLKNGKASYDIVKASNDTSATTSPSDTSGPFKFKMSLKSLEIKNAKIIYDDAAGNMSAALDSFNFSLSDTARNLRGSRANLNA